MIASGNSSYWSWANCLSDVTGKNVSKQGVFKRMNDAWVNTTKTLLKNVLGRQAVKSPKTKVFSRFPNVWLQDSTSFHLPDVLIEKFKGNKSKGEDKSVAKLNVIVHALNGYCPLLEWSNFIVAEQSLSPDILRIAKAGDLVIRDLGYFVMGVFKELIKERIYFLSRLKFGPYIYDALTEEKINLAKLLRGRDHLDIQVICGKEHELKVRLVAKKLPLEQAKERRRLAKKNQQKGINHKKEFYDLLDYGIYITTVGEDIWTYDQVAEAYRVRWNIEILFKSWKSGLRMDQLIPEARTKTERVESYLYLMMIYIALFQLIIWGPLCRKYLHERKSLSILKTTKWGLINALDWLSDGLTNIMEKEILYYCRYDTRKRINAQDKLINIFNPLS